MKKCHIWSNAIFPCLQAGTQSLDIDATSSSQYVDLDLFFHHLSDYVCMTNPSADNCPNGFTLNVYLNIENIVSDEGVITTRIDDGGGYRSGFQVTGAPDTSRLRFCILYCCTL